MTDAQEGRLKPLDNKDCMSEYDRRKTTQPKFGNLVVVINNVDLSNATMFFGSWDSSASSNLSTLCGQFNYGESALWDMKESFCNSTQHAETRGSWTMNYYRYSDDYNNLTKYSEDINNLTNYKHHYHDQCAEDTSGIDNKCQLLYSPLIMVFVLASNMMKLICILLLLYSYHDSILATIGDGIASFMKRTDTTTSVSDQSVEDQSVGRRRTQDKQALAISSMRWKEQDPRWCHALSITRWLILVIP